MAGCVSHCFQLVVKEYFSARESTITNIHKLMNEQRIPLLFSKLRRDTHLRPELNNVT